MPTTPHFAISASVLAAQIGTPSAPWIIDVRKLEAFQDAEHMIAGASWRDHRDAATWARDVGPGRLVTYCVHGHQVSQVAAALLRAAGRSACYLIGGMEDFMARGGPTVRRAALPDSAAAGGGGLWVTAGPPSSGGLACAWLVRRFLDPLAQIHVADADWVEPAAREIAATAFALSDDERPFDSMLESVGLETPALAAVADAVAGRTPMGAGLSEILDGLGRLYGSSEALFTHSATVFDAVYARP